MCLILPGQKTWEHNWCYLKDPDVDYSSLGLLVDQQRLPAYEAKWCIDCKSKEIKDKICTFATNYFTTHAGQNITCQARAKTETRTQSGVSYAAKAHFWDNTALGQKITDYPYPYCKIDLNYYLGNPVITTSPTVSYSATCGAFEWTDVNYPTCRRVYPGFDSGSARAGPSALLPSFSTSAAGRYHQLAAGAGHPMAVLACPGGTYMVGGFAGIGLGLVDEH